MGKRCYGCMKEKQNHPICEHCGYYEGADHKKHHLPLGTVLSGQYEVGRVLGQGGFGITYLGWDRTLEATVAIKEYYPQAIVTRDCQTSLVPQCLQSPEAYQKDLNSFLQEAKILAQLRGCAGIVSVYTFFQENGTAYFVMEYLDGCSLEEYVAQKGGSLSFQETLTLLTPIFEALTTVHQVGLIHQDVSPDNIRLKQNGEIKLLDFGIARSYVNDRTRGTENVLKRYYAPMEQYSGKHIGPWTDVYALCATVYYCLAGRVPPDAPERAIEGTPLNLHKLSLTASQAEALEQGLHLDHRERIPSVKELGQRLSKKRPAWIPPLLLCLALAGALAALWLAAPQDSPPPPTAPTILTEATEAPLTNTLPQEPEPPAPTLPYTQEELSALEPGQLISLGCWEQDGDLENGPEPIRWKVLAQEDQGVLLISGAALEGRPYHHTYERITWENCSLRQWLNEEFYLSAFTPEERALIAQTLVTAQPNPRHATGTGLDTQDHLFLLSIQEALTYFPDDQSRSCGGTTWAEDQGAYVSTYDGGSWWWLRTPGETSRDAATINTNGTIDYDKGSVNSIRGAVRPAMWLRIQQEETP